MRKFAIILVCVLIVSVLGAKNNFKPAIIIGVQNDTLRGFVDYRTDHLNAFGCRFRASENAPDRLIKPGEIAAYKFDKGGKYYVSHSVVIDSLIRNTVFLELMVQGVVNLYYYLDSENSDHYFFEKTKGELLEVTRKRDKISNVRFKVENTWYSNSSNYDKNLSDEGYKTVLSEVFKESSRVSARAAYANFERKDFIELTSQYNSEMGKTNAKNIVYADDNFNTYFGADFSLVGGMQYVDYNSVPAYLIQNYSIESKSVMPVISGQLSLTSQRLTKSLALIIDFSLSRFAVACDYVGKYSTYYNYKLDALKGGSSLGLKYTYCTNKFQPFIEGSLANSFFLFKSSKLDIYDRYFNHEQKLNYILPENVIPGYRFAIGCNFMLKNKHAIVAKINYEKLKDYKDQLSVLELKLGYSF